MNIFVFLRMDQARWGNGAVCLAAVVIVIPYQEQEEKKRKLYEKE